MTQTTEKQEITFGIRDAEMMAAFMHFLYYINAQHFISTLFEDEGALMVQHQKDKFFDYCERHGGYASIRAVVEFVQYNITRETGRWLRLLDYLKEYHWNKW